MNAIFVSDLHGKEERYLKLFDLILSLKPELVFLGGDLLPHHYAGKNFVLNFIEPNFSEVKNKLSEAYPQIFLILGNDDAKLEEKNILALEKNNLVEYLHFKTRSINNFNFFGYSFIPPSPFLLKDWEKYDVSRYTDPGAISPEDGKRTIDVPPREIKHTSIKKDLQKLTENKNLLESVFLFHAPPYKTNLDRAALDGKMIDHVPLDLHVGSIAIREFIEEKKPLLTLHGHIHESARITGSWRDKIGTTHCFSAAHDGKELSVIKFNLNDLDNATRILI